MNKEISRRQFCKNLAGAGLALVVGCNTTDKLSQVTQTASPSPLLETHSPTSKPQVKPTPTLTPATVSPTEATYAPTSEPILQPPEELTPQPTPEVAQPPPQSTMEISSAPEKLSAQFEALKVALAQEIPTFDA